MKPYRFLEEADAEFQEHIRYYDEQIAGLGDKFIADVAKVITQIREYPESGKQLAQHVRKRVLHVFKHNVLYVNKPDEVVIVAVAPHKRKTGYWRKRLKNLR